MIAAVYSAIRVLRLSPHQQSPLFGAILVMVPWLPIPLPPAALLWVGPFMIAVWAAVIAGLVAAGFRNVRVPWLTDPGRARLIAAALALMLYGASALWLSPIFPDGDEPHYLILAQSLFKDGDLRIENNHRRGDYLEYSLTAAAPDYLRRGRDGEIYSIHAPGLPLLIAPAMYLFGYPGVVACLALLAAWSTTLVWQVGYRATGSAGCAWFGWASCALTAPFFFQATEVFPDGVAATCLLIGTLPLWDSLRARPVTASPKAGPFPEASGGVSMWIASGAALAILPWLQTRLAVLAVAAAFGVAWRLRHARQLLAFIAVPVISAALWFGFFLSVYGTPNPTAPYGPYTQTSMANLVRGIPGLLVDQQFGLIPNAPVYGFVLVGVLSAVFHRRRWSWETLLLTVPYVVAVGTYQMWWGGTSVPARLLAPITLVLGVAAAMVWHQIRTQTTRTVGVLALLASVVITATLLGPDHGRLLLNFRDGISLWLEYANDVLDLPKGLPGLFRDQPTVMWAKVAIWAAAALAWWTALRVLELKTAPRGTPPSVLPWHATAVGAVAVMTAFTIAWHVDGARPLTIATADINVLRHATAVQSLPFDFEPFRVARSGRLLSDVRIESDSQRRPAASPTLFSARDLPAGTYEMHLTSPERANGMLSVRIGSTQLPFVTASAAVVAGQPADARIQLASRAQSLSIDGDAAASRSITAINIVRVATPREPAVSHLAHRAARYESADAFFYDEHAYPESTGFWVAGGRTAEVVVASRTDHFDLFVRNAPVENHLTIDVEGEVHELTLGEGEEQLIALPNARGRPFARLRVTSRSGFRPSVLTPGNTDLRYLGCWLEVR